MKLLLIINPKAGQNKGLKTAEYASRYLESKNCKPEIVISKYSGHAVEIAKNCDIAQYQGIIAVGGDGTLFEVINGLLKAHDEINIPIGQVPVGTGNSFIKDLNINSPETALQKIVDKNTKKIDVGFFKCPEHEFYFINLLGLGFVSNVAQRAKKYKSLGALSYIIGVIGELIHLKAHHIELTIDNKVYHRENIFVEICNSTKTGGDMIMAPEAKIDDGLFDVILLNKLSHFKLLTTFPKIFKGTHVLIPEVETFKGRYIKAVTSEPKILTPDGEIIGTTPIEVKMLPHKISMFC